MYDFSPYADGQVVQDGSDTSPSHASSTESSLPVELQIDSPTCGSYTQDTPSTTRHSSDNNPAPRLRPLFLPKELATRHVAGGAQAASSRKTFSPRPLMLPQHVARRSLDLETLVVDAESLVDYSVTGHDASSLPPPPATPYSFPSRSTCQSIKSSHSVCSTSELDLIDWDAVQASAVVMPCYESSPALSSIA